MKKGVLDVDEELEVSPLAELTRSYTERGFKDLVLDICENGLREPVVLWDGVLLDGRHRYKACKKLGLPVRYVDIGAVSEDEALGVVISKAITKDSNSLAAKAEGYVLAKAKGIAARDIPKVFSKLSVSDVNKLIRIEKEDPEFIRILLRQQQITMFNRRLGKEVQPATINALYKVITDNARSKDKIVVQDIDFDYSKTYMYSVAEALGHNEKMIKDFWDATDVAKEDGHAIHPFSKTGEYLQSQIKKSYVQQAKIAELEGKVDMILKKLGIDGSA